MSRCVRMKVIVYMFLPAWGSLCTCVPSGVVDCWRAYPAGTPVPGPFSDGLSFLGFGVSLGCLGWRRPLLAFPPALPGLQIPCPSAQSLCPIPSATLSALLSAFLPLPLRALKDLRPGLHRV